MQFRGALLSVLNCLFNTCYITTDFIETRLYFIKGITEIG